MYLTKIEQAIFDHYEATFPWFYRDVVGYALMRIRKNDKASMMAAVGVLKAYYIDFAVRYGSKLEDFEDVDWEGLALMLQENYQQAFMNEFQKRAPEWYDAQTDTSTSYPWCTPWCTNTDCSEYVKRGLDVEEMADAWLKKILPEMERCYRESRID